LIEKETYYFWKENSIVPTSYDCPADKNFDEWIIKEQQLIDQAEPLSDADLAEREQLLTQGFDSWSKRDYSSFIKAQEKYGRYNLDLITTEIEGKTIEEVTKYSEVFWQRFKELADHEKILSSIEKAEARIQRIIETNNAIDQKLAMYRAPLQQVKFVYGQNKGKAYSEEEDRFLLVMLQKYRYGTDDIYEKIRSEIKKSPLFRFDWFAKSRNSIVSFF
jgi:hypothetical protein